MCALVKSPVIKRIRQWIVATGVSEKQLALIIAVPLFFALNASLLLDYQVDKLWTFIFFFLIASETVGGAGQTRFENDWIRVPFWKMLGLIVLVIIPVVNAAPTLWASRNWSQKILKTND